MHKQANTIKQINVETDEPNLFEGASFTEEKRPQRYCRTCAHRFKAQTNEHSTQWGQYCELFKSKNCVGYVKIKVYNVGCEYYQEKNK